MEPPANPHGAPSEDPTGEEFLAVSASLRGKRLVVSLSGELDMSSAEPLVADVCDKAFDTGLVAEIAIDLGEVSFIDSAGLRALLTLQQEAATAGLRFHVTAVSASVNRLIALAGVEDVLLSSSSHKPS